jgi:catalase
VKASCAFGTYKTTNSMGSTPCSAFCRPRAAGARDDALFAGGAIRARRITARGVKGFATKFYTPQGVFDLLFNQLPVLFVRDGIRFPQAFTSFFSSPRPIISSIRSGSGVSLTVPRRRCISSPVALFRRGTIKSFSSYLRAQVNTFVWRNAHGRALLCEISLVSHPGEEDHHPTGTTMLAGINRILPPRIFTTPSRWNTVQYELRFS